MSIPYDSSNHNISSPQNILSPSDRSQQQPQQTPYANDQEAFVKFFLSQPDLMNQVVRQFQSGILNGTAPMQPPQQTVQQPQVQYTMQQQVPYHQQTTMQIPQQRQMLLQPVYHQQQTPIYQSPQMQFQPTVPQQQPYFPQQQQQTLFQQQQRPASSSVIHYLPNNANQPTSFTPQTQQFPRFQINRTDTIPQQFLEQMHGWNLSDGNLNQINTNSAQPQMTTNQVEKSNSLSFLN